MTDDHASDHDAVAEHDPVTHMDAHPAISDDGHGHSESGLGPIDWRAWGLAILGGAAGLLVLVCFWWTQVAFHLD